MTPREFLKSIVQPAYDEWQADQLDRRKLMHAANELNNMADRLFHYWQSKNPAKVYFAMEPSRYRDELGLHDCADFSLVRYIADGHKHVELTRKNKKVTKDAQTWKRPAGPFHSSFSVDFDQGPERFVVTLDDGTQRDLAELLANVLDMWQKVLASQGL